MLKTGDTAPEFDLANDGGGRTKLADFRGRTLVLYFYPKDDTPGCTREAIAFEESSSALATLGATVVGVSKDGIASHKRFREKYHLGFPLLSDPELSVHKAYGAYGEKTLYGRKTEGTIRSTFVIGPDGVIMRAFPAVRVDGHCDAVVATVTAASGKVGEAKPDTGKGTAKKAAPSRVVRKAAPREG